MAYRNSNKNLVQVTPIPFYRAYVTNDTYNIYFESHGSTSNSYGDTYYINLNLDNVIAFDDRPWIFMIEGNWDGNLLHISSFSDNWMNFLISVPDNMNPNGYYFGLHGCVNVTIGSGSSAVNITGSFFRTTIGNNNITQDTEVAPSTFNQWFCPVFKNVALDSVSISAINYTMVVYNTNSKRFYSN